MIEAPDEIHTARLLLRKPRTTDAAVMFIAYAQDPAVTRYLTWRPHASIAETRAVIVRFLTAWEKQEGFCWFLFRNDTGGMIGSIAARPENDEFNLGFLLARAYWGHGYTPEAIAAVVDWVFASHWSHAFQQLVTWKIMLLLEHKKKPVSFESGFCANFQFTQTSRQLLAIASNMRSLAVSNRTRQAIVIR